VAATNHDLRKLVVKKRFREDLFYRLNVISFRLPALRERRDDIPLLVHHFVEQYSKLNNKQIRGIEPEAMSVLMSRQWPGNVRELENVIERGAVLCQSEQIRLADFMTDAEHTRSLPYFNEAIFSLPFKEAKETVIRAFHRQYIHAILQQSGGNISRAAEQAGLQRQYLHRIIKQEGLDVEGFKQS
jgi:DNA-binding NtrC family response regulator